MPVIRRTNKKRSPEELAAYREKCTAPDGTHLDSIPEKEHYLSLLTIQNAGKIRELKVHPKFTFEVEGDRYGSYEADFSYIDNETNAPVIHDVKAWKMTRNGLKPLVSREFVFQKALLRIQFGLILEEV